MKKQLPKAQSGLTKIPKGIKSLFNMFRRGKGSADDASKLVYKADGTLDNRFKVNRESSSFHSAKNKGTGTGKGAKTENTKKGPSIFDKQLFPNTLRTLNPGRLIYPGIPNAAKLAARNKKTTAFLTANSALAYYLLKRGEGVEKIDLQDQFNFPTNLNTFQMDNTNVNLDSTRNPNFTPNINNKMYLFEKKGGPVKAKGGKIAPGMKSKGGGLKMDRNGKFYR